MRKLLLYGIFPTVGLPGSRKSVEAARPLYKKYAPLIQKLARADWQPVTHARFRNRPADLKVERFGEAAGGVYLAVRNAGAQATEADQDFHERHVGMILCPPNFPGVGRGPFGRKAPPRPSSLPEVQIQIAPAPGATTIIRMTS